MLLLSLLLLLLPAAAAVAATTTTAANVPLLLVHTLTDITQLLIEKFVARQESLLWPKC